MILSAVSAPSPHNDTDGLRSVKVTWLTFRAGIVLSKIFHHHYPLSGVSLDLDVFIRELKVVWLLSLCISTDVGVAVRNRET